MRAVDLLVSASKLYKKYTSNSMQHIPLDSSNIKSVAYFEKERGEFVLEVRFHGGALYEYRDVPEHVYEGLLNAESHGQYFYEHIREAGYPYEKLT